MKRFQLGAVLAADLHPLTQRVGQHLHADSMTVGRCMAIGSRTRGSGPRGAGSDTATRITSGTYGSPVTMSARSGASWAKSARITRDSFALICACGW